MDLPILQFATPADWEDWLVHCHTQDTGVWLQIAKKGAGVSTVTYEEALDVALCYGWVDGQRKSLDERFFVQRFTPRRARSIWSKRNVAKVEQLIAAGRMHPAGQAQVQAAKDDGRWEAAYDSPKDMVLPEDFMAAIQQNEKARPVFETLNKSQRFSIAFQLHNARTPETRTRRLGRILEKLERGEVP
jgi:uncharacterized protein YdeI (YjbR/CyaY-like superfamily)